MLSSSLCCTQRATIARQKWLFLFVAGIGVVLTKSFSLFLDLVRFIAALAVFVEHLSIPEFSGGLLGWRFGRYGAASVMLFFVLSGFVIAYVHRTREKTVRAYFVGRVSRLYSVTIIALLLTWVLDEVGSSINGAFYAGNYAFLVDPSIAGYVASFFFINEYKTIGLGGVAPGTNGPFWSLSFEATYYLVAGLICLVGGWRGLLASIFVLLLGGATIFVLMPIWWFGYFLYLNGNRIRIPVGVGITIALLGGASLAVFPQFPHIVPTLAGELFLWGRGEFHRNVLMDYIYGGSTLLLIVGLMSVAEVVQIKSENIEKIVRRIGLLTFPLYCVHYPAICFYRAVSPLRVGTWVDFVVMVVFVLAISVVVARFAEYLKTALRDGLQNIIPAR